MAEIRVLAGSNGSGKSTFTDLFSKENSVLFNFDKAIANATGNKPEIWGNVKERVYAQLSRSIEYATENKTDVSIVTSYNNEQKPIVDQVVDDLKKNGYAATMVYFHLGTVEDSMVRVAHREAENGFSIDKSKIASNFKEGYENFKRSQGIYDRTYIIDNSINRDFPKIAVTIERDNVVSKDLDSENLNKISELIEGYNGNSRQIKY